MTATDQKTEKGAVDPRKLQIGRRIRLAREDHNLRQAELADLLGVTPAAVGLWETGRTEPKPATLKAICDRLGVQYDWLTGTRLKRHLISTSGAEDNLLRLLRKLGDEDQNAVVRLLEEKADGLDLVFRMADAMSSGGLMGGSVERLSQLIQCLSKLNTDEQSMILRQLEGLTAGR